MLNTLVKLVSSIDGHNQMDERHKNWKFDQLFTPRSIIRWIQTEKPLTFTPVGNLESPINLHVFGLWEEARVPRENPRRHRENLQTPHRRTPASLWV